ncbi:tol-pal system protein YbgF [Lysobacter sp. F6437]|uniref:tol-pal system protein YbgF n=1 Tax=Lysobacter sp. F6437 TaxID=3459296 RepID=UPI00403DC8C5
MRKLSITLAASLVAAAALVAAAPASAQRMSLAERVTLLEQQQGNNQATVDLLRQVNMLKEEVTSLRSQVEQLTHEQEQAKATARAQYLDLDGRLNRMQGGAVPTLGPGVDPTGSDVPVQPPVDTPPAGEASAQAPAADAGPSIYGDPGTLDQVAGEREAYDAAFDALRGGDYAESARQFHAFLGRYPGGAYAPNALYWLGESYYVTQNYKLALEQFEALLQRYPTHDKAPGAMLKVGLSQQGLQQLDAAERTLAEVASRYPGTDAARVASDRLGAIELGRLR